MKKKYLIISIAAVLIVAAGAAAVLARPHAGKNKPWDKVESFTCFYGNKNTTASDYDKYAGMMSGFDVAIIEPKNLSAGQIKKMKNAGTYVIGYLSAGETSGLEKGDGKGPGGSASFYFDADGDGKPDQNGNWGSYYVNAGSAEWQDEVLNKLVDEVVKKKKCDGIFLDTIDTVDKYPDSIDGMVELIKKIREKYPDIKIVDNRGFTVLSDVSGVIDGLMYESFSTKYDFNTMNYSYQLSDELKVSGSMAVNSINSVRKDHYFPVFALDYSEPGSTKRIQKAYNRAWEYDFIPYVSTINLDKVYIHNIKPETVRGSKAYTGEPEEADPNLPPPNKDGNDIALAANGATVRVDSLFAAYGPAALTDGYRNDVTMDWSKIAWASAETARPHYVEIRFPEEKTFGKVDIYWAIDGGNYFTSKKYAIQYYAGGKWVNIKEVSEETGNRPLTEIGFDSVKSDRIRIYQEKGNGPESRPNLMWVSEVEVY